MQPQRQGAVLYIIAQVQNLTKTLRSKILLFLPGKPQSSPAQVERGSRVTIRKMFVYAAMVEKKLIRTR